MGEWEGGGRGSSDSERVRGLGGSGEENVLKLIMVVDAQLCEYTKNH